MQLTLDERWRLQERARRALEEVRRSRYPVVLVLGVGEQMDLKVWQEFAQTSGLTFLDMQEQAAQPGFELQAGAWPTLVDWVREQARQRGGIFVFDLDMLVTRWPDNERERFFLKLLKSETRTPAGDREAPIVATSRLALEYRLPDDTRNYGRILDLVSE